MSDKMKETGKKVQAMGCLLSAVITIPIIGLVVGGPFGLIVGLLLGGMIVMGMVKQAKDKE